MFKKCSLLLIIIHSALLSQNSYTLDSILYNEKAIASNISSADSLLSVLENEKNDSLDYLYYNYAYWLYDVKKLEKAIVFQKKALALAKKRKIKDTISIREMAFDLGFYYSKNSQILKSIEAYNEAISIDNKSDRASRIYLKLAYCYLKINNYNKAIEYSELAIRLLKNQNQPASLREAYQNIATICIFIRTEESLKKGQKYAKYADSLVNLIPKTKARNRFNIKLILAQLYNQNTTLDFKQSLNYYWEAIRVAENSKDVSNIIEGYVGLGDLYNTFNQDKSIAYFEKALSLTKESDSLINARIYSGMGLTMSFKENYEQAIENKRKGLLYFTGGNLLENENIDYDLLFNSKHKTNLLIFLPQLAETYLKLYELKKKEGLLKKAIAYFKMSDYLIDLLKINSNEFKSRLFWREQSTDVYGKAIRACFLMGDTEMAFYFMEKNKALLLLEDIAEQQFKRSLVLPSSFLQKERKLKKQIFEIERKIKENKTGINTLKKELIDTKRVLENLEDSIQGKKNTISLAPEIRSLKEVQDSLNKGEILVEYHVSIDDGYGIYSNKEKGYVLFINKEEVQFFEIPELSNLKKQVSRLIAKVKEPFKTEKAIDDYIKLSHEVFKKLFPTKEIQQFIKDKKLIIIPDSYLSLVPFEALSNSENKINYLIKDSEISYLYSYSFLENTKNDITSKTSFLGVAPGVFENPELIPLSYSKSELENLKTYYKGVTFVSSEASKNKFLNRLQNHNIIHLATHANAQDTISPWIAFNDEKLFLEELYLTKNNASLVVLSGCNTTLGEQEIGEGIISLARGFFYSGTQSVVSSLWSIDDQSTSIIMNDFYKNLYSGQAKSQALRNAKLHYLDTHTLSEVSPHYWASFILLGKNDILKTNTTNWEVYFITFIALLALFLAYRHFYKNRK